MTRAKISGKPMISRSTSIDGLTRAYGTQVGTRRRLPLGVPEGVRLSWRAEPRRRRRGAARTGPSTALMVADDCGARSAVQDGGDLLVGCRSCLCDALLPAHDLGKHARVHVLGLELALLGRIWNEPALGRGCVGHGKH